MIGNAKLLAHIDRLTDRRPITADIFLTNVCNNRCEWCTYGRWDLGGMRKHMQYDEFVKYAERLRELGVEGFILTGGGEPTVNRDFRNIAEWLTEHGYHWGVNTNFNILTYVRPDYIKVSLDGWSEDSYSRIRGVRAYEKTRRNIEAYAAWKKEHSPKTSLGIQMVAESGEDVARFYEANKDLPVDYIVFRPIESTAGTYYKEHSFADVVRVIDHYTHEDRRVVKNFKWDLLGVRQRDCTAQWAQIAVNEWGEVMYCCHKPYEVIGHVMDVDILEKKDRAVTDLGMCDVPCRLTAPNMIMAQIENKQEHACFI